jgi:hypothetical protein
MSTVDTSQPRSTRSGAVQPKYQVFVSSTYQDLHLERQAIAWEILKEGHIPVGMENFSASHERGWEVITETIDLSDYYVLILAGRYGSIDQQWGLSWTEREYRYAIDRGVPVLAFIRSKSFITAENMDDSDTERKRLAMFIADIEKNHHREVWTSTDDLRSKVSVALDKEIRRDERRGHPRPGWYRGDRLPPTAAAVELVYLTTERRELKEQIDRLSDANRKLTAELTALKAFSIYDPEKFNALELNLRDHLSAMNVSLESLNAPIEAELIAAIFANDNVRTSLKQFLNYLENYALAVRSAVIDDDVAYRRMLGVITRWQRVFSPYIARVRTERDMPEYFMELELLAGAWLERYSNQAQELKSRE